jgi:DNA-binding NarL/FixJ family response regulator
MRNKEIAHVLGSSEQSVKNHMTSIFKKLSVTSRVEMGVKLGWVRE